MGILNITPDSFSDGGLYQSTEAAIAHAHDMIGQGAQVIDVGGESTRPGATPVLPAEERRRVVDIVRHLAGEGICVSIDTRHPSVASACIEVGASIINDVSGFSDPAMIELAAKSDVGLVVMHMQGDPQTMQDDPRYDDVVAEVYEYLRVQTGRLEAAGITRSRISVDPGPGFGKAYRHTLELVRNFHEFVRLGYPVMAALSRKGYIGHAYHVEKPDERDEASATEALMACELGASIVRTHNVACTARALKEVRPYALLGLGCNVALVAQPGEEREGKIAQINHAISMLCAMPGSQVIDISGFYESEPAYYESQDPFVNAVLLLRTALAPEDLLSHVHVIENSLGRLRTVKNGPRTCDIDILDYQAQVCDTERLTLPHPRLAERDFVVKPLLEICPGHILADGTPVTTEQVRLGAARRIEARATRTEGKDGAP